MPLTLDLFWSFRSPYSYLALPRTNALVARYDVTVIARPVYPLATRDPTFFQRTNPLFRQYVVRDATRIAEMEGIPFRFPRPDPIVQDLTTLAIAADQPRIRRLTRLGAAAQRAGRGLAFISEVATTLWNGEVNNWHEGDHLARAAARAGLDLAALEATDTDQCDAIITANEADHLASGHWGVPCFVFNGEPFFGQDRLDLLIWRLRQHGLAERRP